MDAKQQQKQTKTKTIHSSAEYKTHTKVLTSRIDIIKELRIKKQEYILQSEPKMRGDGAS